MEIVCRAEAAKKGLNKYYTGQKCKNGHDSYRYTQSGTCAKCINERNIGIVDPTVAARREARAALVLVKLRAFAEDREALAAAAHAFAVMRYPVLLQGDVDPKLMPTGKEPAGTALYSFYCHDQDLQSLRSVANGMLKRPTDVEARRAHIVGQVIRSIEDTTPEWRP